MQYGFESERLYRPRDGEMRQLASVGQLAQWRFHGRGPAYMKIGPRVVYAGTDVIRWLEENRVEPTGGQARRVETEEAA